MKVYLIILGDIGNKHYNHMLESMKKIGQPNQLVDNVYILTIENTTNYGNKESVRNYIAGNEFGYCLILPVDSKLSCAWSLPSEKSELLSKIVKEQKNEEE